MRAGASSALVNRLTMLCLHLLKWRFQPSHRGTNWQLTIKKQPIAWMCSSATIRA
ncbi:MAG TPA: DUF29 family protein [Acetobacteraceae bacterium]|nr:DUF29 family protein [Acetobacteraceae bacterium]